MADVCSALKFIGLQGDAFCFVDEFAQAQDEVDTDAFDVSQMPVLHRFIRCPNHSFLIFNETEAKFDMKDLTVGHSDSVDCKLNLKLYRDVSSNPHDGTAVILYALQGDKKYAAVCKNNTEVCPKEMELDRRVEDSENEAVFYMVYKSTNKFKFKSSRYQQRVLGIGPSGSGLKLMLIADDEDSEQGTFEVTDKM